MLLQQENASERVDSPASFLLPPDPQASFPYKVVPSCSDKLHVANSSNDKWSKPTEPTIS